MTFYLSSIDWQSLNILLVQNISKNNYNNMNSFSGLHYVECFNMGYFQGGGKRPVYLLKNENSVFFLHFLFI